jgi:hypothetical protein
VFAETHNINRIIANDSTFANQAATNTKQATMMAKSLDNLANTDIQKNDAVEKLLTANKKLTKALADANTAIAQLHLPNPPNPLKGYLKGFPSLTAQLICHHAQINNAKGSHGSNLPMPTLHATQPYQHLQHQQLAQRQRCPS